jgi:hypothetical protein
MLTVGLETSTQAEVGSAVQVFNNLHILKPRVEQILQNLHEKTTKAIRSALNVHDLKVPIFPLSISSFCFSFFLFSMFSFSTLLAAVTKSY